MMNANKILTMARKIALPPIQDHKLFTSSFSSSVLHLRFLCFLPLCNNFWASNSSCMVKTLKQIKKCKVVFRCQKNMVHTVFLSQSSYKYIYAAYFHKQHLITQLTQTMLQPVSASLPPHSLLSLLASVSPSFQLVSVSSLYHKERLLQPLHSILLPTLGTEIAKGNT